MTHQPKDFLASPVPGKLNPSTFRPPDNLSETSKPLEQHLTQFDYTTTKANLGTQTTRSDASPTQGTRTLSSRAQVTQETLLHTPSISQVSQVMPARPKEGCMDHQPEPSRRKRKWRRRITGQCLRTISQFETTISVLLFSIIQRCICRAGICREVEHSLVSVSTVRALGLQIHRLPPAASWDFLSPWGIVRSRLFTGLVIGPLVEGNPQVEMGNVIVLDDAFFSGLDVGIILGRAFLDKNFGGHLRQPALVHLGQSHNWLQNAAAGHATPTPTDNSGGGSFMTPLTPVFYPINGQTLSLGMGPIVTPPMYHNSYHLTDPYQTPPQSSMGQIQEQFAEDDSGFAMSPHQNPQFGAFPAVSSQDGPGSGVTWAFIQEPASSRSESFGVIFGWSFVLFSASFVAGRFQTYNRCFGIIIGIIIGVGTFHLCEFVAAILVLLNFHEPVWYGARFGDVRFFVFVFKGGLLRRHFSG
ncbi:hypothetical protein QBC44DRAFT_386809 [Cladorrhinum sp. PSN332]|nr:hypothetical protein QBC44DRAFT_386809 [Cladorrhinum sp. PSN332]